jgi:(p)ppGpp synthase/HD superfamily hydrolase
MTTKAGRPQLEDALILAAEVHRGQEDLAGERYILHPLKLMMSMSSEVEMMVALLHDVVEDTGTTLADLESQGYSSDIVAALDAVTKRPGETYEDYLPRVEASAIARKVKIADLEHNLDVRRLPTLTGEDLKRVRKYRDAWARLALEAR